MTHRATVDTSVRDAGVCVVGAGPHGLCVVCHLLTAVPSLRNRIEVIDPSGSWLHVWREQFARLEIDVLRSPGVHHPDVDPGALGRFVRERNLARSGLPYDPPLTATFDEFCAELIERHDAGGLVTEATVTGIDVGETTEVATSRGAVRARHVVWAGNPSTRVGVGDIPTPIEPSVVHGADVDLRSLPTLAGERVVVVGGGLSAGHLVVGALNRSAQVTLITRRPIEERDFDIGPGWMGPKYLDGYARLREPGQRYDAARAARGGGTMPAWMHRRLAAETEAGRLTHLVGEAGWVDADAPAAGLRVADHTVIGDRYWLATGSVIDVRVDAALAPVVEERVEGVPVVDDDLRVCTDGPFVSGGLATLELGPGARNLWGSRRAARRICRAITGIDLDGDAMAVIEPPPPLRTARRHLHR